MATKSKIFKEGEKSDQDYRLRLKVTAIFIHLIKSIEILNSFKAGSFFLFVNLKIFVYYPNEFLYRKRKELFMAQKHISDEPKAAATKGGLLLGANRSLLLDGDLASTNAEGIKTAVETRGRALHVSERTIAGRVTPSVDAIAQFDSTYLGGSDADKATMQAISTSEGGRSLNY